MSSMIPYSLDGEWQFRQAGSEEWLPACVPGGVHTDLLAAGRLADPFAGDEEQRVQWVAEQDWEYRRHFTLDAGLPARQHVFLVCEGLDTLAEVQLNGQVVGTTESMFRAYRWEVRQALRAGENEVSIRFRSPVQYALQRQNERPLPAMNDPIPGAPYLRKAPSHFGWDWGPRLPPIGIWRAIRLEGYGAARLDEVHVRQRHTAGGITLAATVTAEIYEQTAFRLRLRLAGPDGQAQTAEAALDGGRGEIALDVEGPQLWWPNGYGPQPLYQLEVALVEGDTVLDAQTYQVGLRTIELRRQPDAWGESFTFVVNGVPIFAKGANWIPADSFPTRITAAQLDHLVGSAAAAHHNMVRVWGGGFYEDEAFYDCCDHYGILVWQDFMFACAVYPLTDPAFVENVRAEVVANVRRLRHRACLALWCGNNEMDGGWVAWGWDTPEHTDLKAAYVEFFYHTLPGWMEAADPDHVYWPSSPSSGVPLEDPDSGARGDIHQWSVWHASKPFRNYRETVARFVSEFGFESLPALATVATFAAPADWNITSYIMEYHQRSPVGNEKIIGYMLEHFRLPKDFAALVYLSQLLQGEAMRYAVEHWRRHPACSGALYWQLDDCWPVVSWSSIDYYGRWKVLQYASRRFFAPVLLSIEDEGTHMDVFITNDTVRAWTGQVRWALETLDGTHLDGGETDAHAAALTTTRVQSLDFATCIDQAKRREAILVCELWQGDARVQTVVATFAPTKHLALGDPQIAPDVQQDGGQLVIQLQARTLARFVEVTLEGADVVFSDNYFDLPAGRPVRITCPIPEGWTPEHAQGALRVQSVFNSY